MCVVIVLDISVVVLCVCECDMYLTFYLFVHWSTTVSNLSDLSPLSLPLSLSLSLPLPPLSLPLSLSPSKGIYNVVMVQWFMDCLVSKDNR